MAYSLGVGAGNTGRTGDKVAKCKAYNPYDYVVKSKQVTHLEFAPLMIF